MAAKLPRKGGIRTGNWVYPIDLKLRLIGRDRSWLARKCGISTQCLGNYINGKRLWLPNRPVTQAVMEVLKVDINFLIYGAERSE